MSKVSDERPNVSAELLDWLIGLYALTPNDPSIRHLHNALTALKARRDAEPVAWIVHYGKDRDIFLNKDHATQVLNDRSREGHITCMLPLTEPPGCPTPGAAWNGAERRKGEHDYYWPNRRQPPAEQRSGRERRVNGAGDMNNKSGRRWMKDRRRTPGTRADRKCDTCHGTGQVMVGYSGQESDGNAPEFERCPECGYGADRAEDQRESAAVMAGHQEGAPSSPVDAQLPQSDSHPQQNRSAAAKLERSPNTASPFVMGREGLNPSEQSADLPERQVTDESGDSAPQSWDCIRNEGCHSVIKCFDAGTCLSRPAPRQPEAPLYGPQTGTPEWDALKLEASAAEGTADPRTDHGAALLKIADLNRDLARAVKRNAELEKECDRARELLMDARNIIALCHQHFDHPACYSTRPRFAPQLLAWIEQHQAHIAGDGGGSNG